MARRWEPRQENNLSQVELILGEVAKTRPEDVCRLSHRLFGNADYNNPAGMSLSRSLDQARR
jgi:hypothetical protein